MSVKLAALRRYVVAQNGFASRDRAGSAREVEAAIRRLHAVQLDSISAVDRAHRLTLGARVGAYPRGTVTKLLAQGRVFEYWAHEACLLPIEDFPLFRRRMIHLSDRHWWGRQRRDEDPAVRAEVEAALRERGPLPVRAFEGRSGPMWGWKPAKRALEFMFAAGEVVVAGRQGFQRLYALPEQVIPKQYLEAPAASEEEFRRLYALRAVRARGALTESAIAEHCRFDGGARAIRPVVDALVADGLVRRVDVEDGGAPVVVLADAELNGDAPSTAVLLCPFDSILWDRAWVARLFGFQHVIEVYKREHERIYGYYVLPFLWKDRIVGRADVKADRAGGVLRIKAFHLEPGVRASKALDEAFEKAASRLARLVGVETVSR